MVRKHSAIFLIIIFYFNILSFTKADTPGKIVCYYSSSAANRPGRGRVSIEDLDPSIAFKCTHLIYAFVGLNPQGTLKPLGWAHDSYRRGFEKFNKLKYTNKYLKTLIALGGWSEGSTIFSQVFSSPQTRLNLIHDIINWLSQHGFDGVDLDWEYPNQRGGSHNDIENYVAFLREFRQIAGSRYLLTAAVPASARGADISYHVTALSQYLDWINLMAYDYHTGYDPNTGNNAPLFPGVQNDGLNTDSGVKAWIQRGADPRKLVLGLPAFGHSFTLKDPRYNEVGAPCSGPGYPGPYGTEAGTLNYAEVCQIFNEGGWRIFWDKDQMVPYAVKGNQWISYDNIDSISEKVNYAKESKLGGIMLWSIDNDDVHGLCGESFPILNTIVKSMHHNNHIPDTGFVCKQQGFFADPHDCTKFYRCVSNFNNYETYHFDCPPGTKFDIHISTCNHVNIARC